LKRVIRSRPLLGTFVTVECVAPSTAQASTAIDEAFACIATVARLMHPTRNDSDLVAISDAPRSVAVAVHAWTWEVLRLSKHLNELTEGRFDPCLPDADGCISDIELPAPGIVLRSKPVLIDLGGIAKGFAVDRAVDALKDSGCRSGIVNAGGDLRVFGAEDRTIWIRADGGAWPVALRDRALAVSDRQSARHPSEHRGYYCRVARATLLPNDYAAVTAATGAVADGMTKAVLLYDRGHAALRAILASLDAATVELS
jgi:thiamine biosynthesis lipoprotein